ncbi:MAG TPA: histidinol-phosphate transaminase [Candidatus Copromorpha excrementigallinarum]|uniref:Histidinol-phosphate aminotransferase n=1 Tax=Candidatus Allocopromorpha excrementigallinarum TaxID=2840742 RepID=A0A9D1L743_9FIRM|nr:histidinol-phosphate transaminase [Candidatus Copromorpha excrementigallinarum]
MSRFLDERYKELEPYTPGEQPKNLKRLIKLNTNENPYPPAPGVLKIISREEAEGLRLYSDPEAAELAEAIGDFYGIDKSMIMTGNGSDEILAFIFMIFQGKNRRFYFPEISYSFYPVYCDVFGAEAVKVPLASDFSVNPRDYERADGTIVITNPNAPTGMAMSLKDIERILKSNRENLVVIDEAYVDFGAESCVKLLKGYDNLLVVQTFSKSRSLAGARIGFALGHEEVIADLNRIKFSFNPYNLNRLSIKAGVEAMRDREYFEQMTGRIIRTREKFVSEMEKMGFILLPSKANFVFARHESIPGEEYFTKLRKYNIIVRYFGKPRIRDFVRITIGTDNEMEELLTATQEILKEYRQEDPQYEKKENT